MDSPKNEPFIKATHILKIKPSQSHWRALPITIAQTPNFLDTYLCFILMCVYFTVLAWMNGCGKLHFTILCIFTCCNFMQSVGKFLRLHTVKILYFVLYICHPSAHTNFTLFFLYKSSISSCAVTGTSVDIFRGWQLSKRGCT